MVAVMRVVAVVNVAEKAAVTMKPGAGTNKHSAHKPIGAVVAVRGTVIGSVVEVPIGAHGRHSNVNGNLGRCDGGPGA
jgi:hypothetical protein